MRPTPLLYCWLVAVGQAFVPTAVRILRPRNAVPRWPPHMTTASPPPAPHNHTSHAIPTAVAHESASPNSSISDYHTAIVLNTNARSVSAATVQQAVDILGEAHVYQTTTADEAAAAARSICQRGYKLVLPVGGDGTLSSLVNLLCNAVVEQQQQSTNDTQITLEQAMTQLPTMAYLPMGTGNGVGSVVGNPVRPRRLWGIFPRSRRRQRQQFQETLQRLQALGAQLAATDTNATQDNDHWDWITMPMMQVTTAGPDAAQSQGDLCFFAGVGFDSLMLNDFKRVKAWSIRTGILTKMLTSVAGYCVALIVRTLPAALTQGRHNIHVALTTRHPESTLWVDHRRGDVVRPVISDQLYTGSTGILAAGTSPFYGGGLRLFPFARLTTTQMHLRVGRIHPLTGFVNMPGIFAGTYRDRSDRLGCLDFIGDDFDVSVAPLTPDKRRRGYPFQHSGESMGHVDRFRLRVVKEPVRFVCLKTLAKLPPQQ